MNGHRVIARPFFAAWTVLAFPVFAAVAARDAKAAAEWMTRHTRDFRRGYEVAGIDLATEVAEAPVASAVS